MKILERTTGGNTGEKRIEKSIGALFLSFEGIKALTDLKSSLITVFVQRANGDDFRIATKMPVLQFMAMSVNGDSSIMTDAKGTVSALCELNEFGSIPLEEKDGIVISIDALPVDSKTVIYGIEYPAVGGIPVEYEKKTVSADITTTKFSVLDKDLLLIDGYKNLNELTIRYSNGISTKYVPAELRAISQDLDPMVGITDGGSVQIEHPDFVLYPLSGAVEIEVFKDSTAKIDFFLLDTNLDDEEGYDV